MTWDSGPCLPPGALVLTADQARAFTTAIGAVAEAFEAFAVALAPLRDAAGSIELDPDTVHLRAVRRGERS